MVASPPVGAVASPPRPMAPVRPTTSTALPRPVRSRVIRKSKILAKFRSGGFARVCGLGHYLPFYVRHAAHENFDGIWLDLEHRAMGPRELQAMMLWCQRFDIDCMVRAPTLEHTRLYRYLEDGASGLMMPLVPDAARAEQIVQAVKVPPQGNRGLDGAGLDADFGLDFWRPDTTYCEDANEETFLITQLESPEAVANAESIAAVPGVDGLFIGPGDLGRRLQVVGREAELPAMIESVAAAARNAGKAWAITASSIEDIRRYREMGAQLVPWGGDFWLMNVLKKCRAELDTVPGA